MIKKYTTNLYPCDFYVAVDESAESLLNKFDICKVTDFYQKSITTVEEFEDYAYTTYAITFPIRNKKSNNIGVLVYIVEKQDITVSHIAHESVHVADYIFDFINSNTQTFADGNEPYAYTVGWAAGCISNTLKSSKL